MKPKIGDEIFMKSMGSDVYIEVSAIADEQPLYQTDGVYVISDQYGEDHLVERDGDHWIVTSDSTLSDEGWFALDALRAARSPSFGMG